MAKRRKSLISKFGLPLLGFFAILVIACAMLSAVFKKTGDTITEYNGFTLIFGGTVADLSILGIGANTHFNFSILGFLAYFLPLIGFFVAAILNKKRGLGAIIMALCFVASAVLLFLLPMYTNLVIEQNIISTTETVYSLQELEFSTSTGTLVGGLVSCFGFLISSVYFTSN